jgi:hypothetical protein
VCRAAMIDPPATFGLHTPQDLIAKLERELVRLNAARNPEDMIDHGLNFAISAWHMADWMAQYHECHDKLRAKLKTDTVDKGELLQKLQKFARTECPKLENCRVIATFAKHLECTRPPPRDPTFKANEAPGKIIFVNNDNEPLTFVNEG